MVEESKVTDKQLEYFAEETTKGSEIRTIIRRDFLGGRSDFASAWKKATREQKVQVYELWEASKNKDDFAERVKQHKAGQAQMETVAGGSDKGSQKSVMSKFDKDQIQTAVDKMSPQGKKIMQQELETEQIDTGKLADKVEMLPKQDQKILAKQLGVEESKVVEAVENMSMGVVSLVGIFDNLNDAINNLPESSKSKISIKGEIENQEQAKQVLQQIEILPSKEQLQIRKAYNDDIIEQKLESLSQTHPKSMSHILDKFSDINVSKRSKNSADMSLADFNKIDPIPVGNFMDSNWFKINKRREKIYDRIKSFEQQQLPTMTEHNKHLYKEVTRNGGQRGADLAVVENKHGIEEYRVRYPTVDEALKWDVIDQYAFDLAQKRHMSFVQQNLFQDILKSGQSVVIPNIQFLQDKYKHSGKQEDFDEYLKAVVQKNHGQPQLSYNGQQDWTNYNKQALPSRNFATPSLTKPLTKPNFIQVHDLLLGIQQMADYISKLTGNLNTTDLKHYAQVNEVFSNQVVKKMEPNYFKPQSGMAFKLRKLMC